jgi:UDP-N-acetylmuramyl pentapeptide phosphotransferase/UDP-N-acetylglucosamine-1-phosphate transferase
MDGINGIAGLQAIVAGGFLIISGVMISDQHLLALGFLTLSASAGFLILNIIPARIFMGDAGSYALGFLFAAVPAIRPELFVPMLMVLGAFIFDSTVTLFRRMLRGEKWYQAHRTHLYQRAVALGVSHLRVSCVVAGMSVVFVILAVMFMKGSVVTRAAAVSIEAGILCAARGWVIYREHQLRT